MERLTHLKTNRGNFILTTAGTSFGALNSGCASPDRTAKPTTVTVEIKKDELVFEAKAAKK